MFASCDMLIVLAKIVDMLAVDAPDYLQALLASFNTFGRNLPTMAKIFADAQGHLMLDGLIGEHSNLFCNVNSHRLIIL